MEYLGKKIVRCGDLEFIGDEYAISINNVLWKQVLVLASEKQLNCILQEQVRFENFEVADEIKKVINDRFKSKVV